MATTKKDPVVVVLQMTGANDYLNTIIPYTNGHYRDARPKVGIPEDQVLPIDGELAFNPNMGPIKKLYDEGKVAIIHGIGYENSPRSHFRSMDIWHTCEPDIVGTEGWAGRVIRELDPNSEERLEGSQLRAGIASCPVAARSARNLGLQPRVLRCTVQRPRAWLLRPSGPRSWSVSPGCTPRR